VESGTARTPRVILVRDGSTEQRHDPVTGELVDGPLEAVDAVGQNLEEAIEDPMPRLGVHLLGKLHRTDHVGEQHGHLLALAFERAAGGENPLGQMARRVGARLAGAVSRPAWREPLAAGVAEPLVDRIHARAMRAGDAALE